MENGAGCPTCGTTSPAAQWEALGELPRTLGLLGAMLETPEPALAARMVAP